MSIQAFSSLFTAFGLSTAAGLNAWITLFGVALAARFQLVTLSAPYDVMATTPVLGGLGVIMLIEGLADKIPLVDHASHLVHIVLQPVAGAIAFASQAGVITDTTPWLAFFVGALVAGSVHGTRATIRPAVTASTGGMGNVVVSFVEDGLALALVVLCLVVPLLAVLLILLLGWRVLRWRRRRVAAP